MTSRQQKAQDAYAARLREEGAAPVRKALVDLIRAVEERCGDGRLDDAMEAAYRAVGLIKGLYDIRFVECEACDGEGRVYRHQPFLDDPYFEYDAGPCSACSGSGVTETETQPVECDDEVH